MIEDVIERHVIRAAIVLAATSTLAQTPDGVTDLREEAAYVLRLCMQQSEQSAVFQRWCDDVSALLRRLLNDSSLPEKDVLRALAAVLRLRLAVTQSVPKVALSELVTPSVDAPVKITEKQKQLLDFIAEHPGIRTKDLVSEFGVHTSVRTLKRCLKELSDAGMVRRTKLDDGGVSYRV